MTQSKHTKGPWNTWTTGAPNAPVIIYTGNVAPKLNAKGYPKCAAGSYIAEVSSNHMYLDANDDIVQHNNAALIKSAPDLLNALLMVADISGHKLDGLTRGQIINLIKDIRDNEALPAIAKAKGL